MRCLFAGFTALLLALMALPAFAADDKTDKDKKDPAPDVKKDADKDKPDAKKDADKEKKEETFSEKYTKLPALSGKVSEVNESAKSIKVDVTIEISKPNLGEMQALAQANAQLAQAYAQRNYGAIPGIEQQIYQHKAHQTNIEKQTKNVEYTTVDDVKVRLEEPPTAFDDKGKVKKWTAKELRELKGNPKDPDYKLPGYPGAFSDIHQGSMVTITPVKSRNAAHHTGPKPKDADPAADKENLPEAGIILILPDPPGTK